MYLPQQNKDRSRRGVVGTKAENLERLADTDAFTFQCGKGGANGAEIRFTGPWSCS